jgi:hypothetical protein
MSRAEALLENLREFYDDPANAKMLMDILDHKCGVSLRTLESFVTKKDSKIYVTKSGRRFAVHVAYKSSLVGYSKKLFDPFCRTDRIDFLGRSTTVAQLNFIKWCIVNEIIDILKPGDLTKTS